MALRRGDLIVVAAKGEYASKPHPAVVVQADAFASTGSLTICLLSSDEVDAALLRYVVEPSASNGLATRSWAMIDKLTAVRRDRLAEPIGRLSDIQMAEVGRLLAAFLGIV